MFRVAADSLEAYLAFDPARTGELEALHALIRKSAPARMGGDVPARCVTTSG